MKTSNQKWLENNPDYHPNYYQENKKHLDDLTAEYRKTPKSIAYHKKYGDKYKKTHKKQIQKRLKKYYLTVTKPKNLEKLRKVRK